VHDGEQQRFWEAVSELLQERIPRPDYYSWFAMAQIDSVDSHELVLSFPNEFAAGWVQERFTDVLAPIVAHVAGRELGVRCVSRETAKPELRGEEHALTPVTHVELPAPLHGDPYAEPDVSWRPATTVPEAGRVATTVSPDDGSHEVWTMEALRAEIGEAARTSPCEPRGDRHAGRFR